MVTLERTKSIKSVYFGRPTVMTPEVLNKLQLAFCIDATDKEACAFAGISEKTLYNYQRKNPDFLQQKQAWKSMMILKARQSVFNAIGENPRLALQYLTKKLPEEFGSCSVKRRYIQNKEKPISVDTKLKNL